jgi:hypothetical protein
MHIHEQQQNKTSEDGIGITPLIDQILRRLLVDLIWDRTDALFHAIELSENEI